MYKYINWAALTIDILCVCGLPSDEYISIGPLRRLIYYMFVDYPPMNINWAAPTIDILNLDYPPIINVFRLPSKPFFSRLISCTNSYNPRMFQCIWNGCMPFPIQSNHMQICKPAHIHIISNHTIMSCNFHFKHIKISSLGLIINHEQFNLNHSAKHIFSKKI